MLYQANAVQQPQEPPLALDSYRTLWMGDLQEKWNADFVADAFKHLGHDPITVKVVKETTKGRASGYCFVEFTDAAAAREAMLVVNGQPIHGSDPPSKFNLSFANDAKMPSVEYNLFVNNLSTDVTDAELYQVFGRRYQSCRGAKIYRHEDGTSRGLGFVRFGNQTEQQQALIELNHTPVRGKEMTLKMAAAKQRLPRHQIAQGYKPFLISGGKDSRSDPSGPGYGGYNNHGDRRDYQDRRDQRRSRDGHGDYRDRDRRGTHRDGGPYRRNRDDLMKPRQPTAREIEEEQRRQFDLRVKQLMKAVPVMRPHKPLTAEEHNHKLALASRIPNEFEESSWNPFVMDLRFTRREFMEQIRASQY